MLKIFVILFTIIGCSFAKPAVVAAPFAYSAPLVAAPIVTAQSSQYFSRNYNGLAAAYTAPLTDAYTAQVAAGYTAPLAYSAYSSYPYASPYTTFL